MSIKTIGGVGRGSGLQKVGIELGSYFFNPNSSQPGMFQTFAKSLFLKNSICAYFVINMCALFIQKKSHIYSKKTFF